jgi:prophage regulatory protein
MQTTHGQVHNPRPIPSGLDDVALIDIGDVCAAVRMSISWVHEEVRQGRFPKPLRFGPRCSRWRLSDVRAWLLKRAQDAEVDDQTSVELIARAKKASEVARAKRLEAGNRAHIAQEAA